MPHFFNLQTSDYRESWDHTTRPLGPEWVEVLAPPPDDSWRYTWEAGQYVERPEAELMPRYREAKEAELAAWYAAAQAAGVPASGLVLAASKYDQDRLGALASGVNTGLLAGVLGVDSPMPAPVWDVSRVPHTLTVGEFMSLALQYMAGVAAVESQWQAYHEAIDAAAAKADLDALQFGA